MDKISGQIFQQHNLHDLHLIAIIDDQCYTVFCISVYVIIKLLKALLCAVSLSGGVCDFQLYFVLVRDTVFKN